MRLPQLPYNRQDTQRQILTFGGLNLTDTASDGELKSSKNLSALRFPYLAARKGRERLLSGVENVTAIFEWDGRLVYVSDGVLYLDGVALGDVEAGEKQFAVVNTKLIVWPDKLYIDLTTDKLGRLDEKIITSTGVSVSGGNSFTAIPKVKTAEAQMLHTFKLQGTDPFNPGCYFYGKDEGAFANCFDENGWNFTMLEALPGYGAYGFISGDGAHCDGQVEEGMIFIPRKNGNSFDYVYADLTGADLPDTDKYNDEGYYGVLTYDDSVYSRTFVQSMWYVDIYKVGAENALFSASFSTGDVVNIYGTLYGASDVKQGRIESIDEATNTLVFANDTFNPPGYYKEIENGLTAETQYALRTGGDGSYLYYEFTPDQDIEAGRVLLLYPGETSASSKIRVIDAETYETIAEINVTGRVSDTDATKLATDGYSFSTISIQRVVPDLDFICERDNRLFGVSNNVENEIRDPETGEIRRFTSRCIYVSALGLPERFWDFEGLDTDSYQVAVGSEGDFTAISNYENACLFFKEDRIYKLYGDYPSAYSLSDDRLPGVQQGSHRSIDYVNGLLYYKAPHGVYAYNGSSSKLVSEKLGELLPYGNAVGGFDGRQYYISMIKGETAETFVYDTFTDIWLRVNNDYVDDFELYGNRLAACIGGKLYYLESESTDGDEEIVWSAELAPMAEKNAHERKNYLRLLLRVQIGQDGYYGVYIKRFDEWTLVKELTEVGEYTSVIPLSPNRIDKLEIKLEGTAPAQVLSLACEYKVGSVFGGEHK